jgi:autotransporter-associated beta strand protein
LTFGGAGNIILGPIPQPTGTIALALNSTGTITLTGANTFTNGTTLSAGTLALDSDTALGTGALNIGGGTALDATLPGIVQTNNNAQSWDGNFTFDGTYSLNLGAGAVTLTGNRTVTVNANTLTVGGPISGGYGITKAGAGTLLLSGHSTYSGATSVSNGVLEVSGSVSSTSSVTVSAGGVFYLANGSLSVSGGVTNNGIFKLFGTTALSLTGSFINNGVLDLINGTQSLPPNFTNNGTVLDASSVQVRQLGMTGSNFSVTIQGYAQHTYQLQRSITLAAPVTWTNVGPPQTGAGSPLTFTDNGGATALQGFYQVQVSP